MRTRPTSDHADAVARRLELLRAELDSPGEEDEGEEEWQPPWWDGPGATETAELDPLVPVPGRHASRRQVVISPDAVLPEPLRGRVSLGPWHLVVVSLVLVAGLAVACWWMIRADPEVVPAARAVPSASPLVPLPTDSAAPGGSAAAPSAGASAGASAGTVTVDVEGKVPKPGIVVLPVGSRVVDAVEAAGGAPHKHLAGLNLAALLSDGQQIMVGAPNGGAGVAAPGAGGPAGPGVSGAGVSLNAASMAELETLPGVGPVTAQAIIDWRTTNGAFSSVDELLEVDGIGPKTYDSLKPLVTL